MSEWERKEIEVARLTVDLGNFRIGDHESVRDAYKAMLAEQQQNIVRLAADLIELGPSPSELPIVVPDPGKRGQFIVVEGNRRLTAIRMMETPALASGTDLHSAFVSLSKEYAKRPIKKLFCVLMNDKPSAMKWIDRKHLMLAGRGLAQWNAQATSRADAYRGKVRPSKAILEYLESIESLPAAVGAALASKTTNVDRVFQMPYLKSALGVAIAKDGSITFASGDAKRGNELLLRMLKAIAAPGFTVNNIKTLEQRQDFIDQFSKYGVVSSTPSDASTQPPAATASAGRKKTARKTPLTIERTTLAIKGAAHRLQIQDERLGSLYNEALILQPEKLPSTSGVITRVFLELSTDLYLVSQRVPLTVQQTDKGRKKWTDIGISLKDKIAAALAHVDPGKSPALKQARKGLSDADAIHSVQSLHEYVHSLESDPDPREVKRIWARWHPFLAVMFEQMA